MTAGAHSSSPNYSFKRNRNRTDCGPLNSGVRRKYFAPIMKIDPVMSQDQAVIEVFKTFFKCSFVVACVVQALVLLWPTACAYSKYGVEPGQCRATYYFAATYLTIVPYFYWVLRSNIPVAMRPNISPMAKVLGHIGAWILLPIVASTPFILLSSDQWSTVKNRLLYELVTESFVGLLLAGSIFAFGACLSLWVLLGVFSIFRKNKD